MEDIEQENLREHIASLVLEGYIAGFSPNWRLSFSDILRSEISEASIKHIANQIKDWVKIGEIQEDDKEGWWFLKIGEE